MLDAIDDMEATPSHAQTIRMRSLSSAGKLDTDTIRKVMREQKANQKPVYRIQSEKLERFIKPDTSQKQAEDFIIKACEYYSKYLLRKRDKDAR